MHTLYFGLTSLLPTLGEYIYHVLVGIVYCGAILLLLQRIYELIVGENQSSQSLWSHSFLLIECIFVCSWGTFFAFISLFSRIWSLNWFLVAKGPCLVSHTPLVLHLLDKIVQAVYTWLSSTRFWLGRVFMVFLFVDWSFLGNKISQRHQILVIWHV